MRPRAQGSAAKEEEEHPYELLLTAETKKLVSADGKTKGTNGTNRPVLHQAPQPAQPLCPALTPHTLLCAREEVAGPHPTHCMEVGLWELWRRDQPLTGMDKVLS